MRSPVTWYGGKGHLWRRIVPHLPCAGVACYVEPCGGGASVLPRNRSSLEGMKENEHANSPD